MLCTAIVGAMNEATLTIINKLSVILYILILVYLFNLETVCKKCIYNKITREELDCCPVCKVYLGCAPLERLRYFL